MAFAGNAFQNNAFQVATLSSTPDPRGTVDATAGLRDSVTPSADPMGSLSPTAALRGQVEAEDE